MSMYFLNGIADDIYRWGYGEGVGFIPKKSGGEGSSEKDAEQDQKIEQNEQHINDNDAFDQQQQSHIDSLRRDLEENTAKDQQRQQQLDQNDQTDIRQQTEIDENRSRIEEIVLRDDGQQLELDELRAALAENTAKDSARQEQLNANDARDDLQQAQIDENRGRITNVESDLTDFDVNGTTLVITRRGDN